MTNPTSARRRIPPHGLGHARAMAEAHAQYQFMQTMQQRLADFISDAKLAEKGGKHREAQNILHGATVARVMAESAKNRILRIDPHFFDPPKERRHTANAVLTDAFKLVRRAKRIKQHRVRDLKTHLAELDRNSTHWKPADKAKLKKRYLELVALAQKRIRAMGAIQVRLLQIFPAASNPLAKRIMTTGARRKRKNRK